MVRIYLSHTYSQRDIGKRYQALFELLGHEVYNPFDHDVECVAFTSEWANNRSMEVAHKIVNKDHYEIEQSDWVVILLFPSHRHAIGTLLELAYARRKNKYVVVFTDLHDHPWLMAYCDLIVPIAKLSGLNYERNVIKESS
jgi:nucleoside 2-deoxyribosyltransferase